jgi:hypothetical protein
MRFEALSYLLEVGTEKLRCWNNKRTLLGYYLEKYVREEYGTMKQLEAGIKDHRTDIIIPEENLLRLIRAWQAMTEKREFPKAYEVGGDWTPIIFKAFAPLTKALDEENLFQLNSLLGNFFRRFGDFFGEPTTLTALYRLRRCQEFRAFSSRWIDLYGENSLAYMGYPLIGNPVGFLIGESLFTRDSFRHNFYAKRMSDLVGDLENPIICEIGGGYGGFAYYLLKDPDYSFRYVDYDIPVICVLAAYYLLSTLPGKRIGLYGEVDSLEEPLRNCDAAVLPNFALPHLGEQSVDVCFNSCSFAEMDELSVREYMRQFERVSRGFILHENHCWEESAHWDLSSIEPSSATFSRIHKIPSPFHSDLYGRFFEWLYMRR